MPRVIDTREELASALTTAAELEHNLLLEYLFAAFSLKNAADDDLTWHQAELCRQWERNILRVARSEMAHLGMVCNLLSAIGHAPQFGRRNFPQQPTKTSPFDYELTPFSDETLYRFMRAEQPSGRRPRPPFRRNAPKTLSADYRQRAPFYYKHTGELYRAIESAFSTIDGLFIGPKADQDRSDWSNNFTIAAVTDAASARHAIAGILHDGEGAPRHREGSHYDVFEDIRDQLEDEGYFEARCRSHPTRASTAHCPTSRQEASSRTSFRTTSQRCSTPSTRSYC